MHLSDIINIINGSCINSKKNDVLFKRVIIDSREVKKNDLFIALKGKNYDAHNYIQDILNKKPSAIIVERNINIDTKIPIIKVESTHNCLIQIGKYYRSLFHGNIIAITGSVGKTTTKELISIILSKKYNVVKSDGNRNNHIGVPMTLTKLNNSYDIAVLELGMNHKNEISKLSSICNPNLSVITNIGTAHIGNLGSKKEIYKAKLEIVDGMNKGKLIINSDDDYLKKMKKINNIDIIKCGLNNNELKVTNIKYDIFKTIFRLIHNNKEYEFTINVPGTHIINDCILAIKVGQIYNVSFEDMIDAINEYKPLNNRLNIKEYEDNILIDDCYNSNYESVIALINYIKNINKAKIIILGDILELGKYSKVIHKRIGKYLNKNGFKNIIFVGKYMYYAHKKNKNSFYFKNNEDVIEYLKSINIINKLILIKGSRGMHLEEISLFLESKLKK